MKNNFMGVANAFIETVNECYIGDKSNDRAIIMLAAEDNRLSKIVKGNCGMLEDMLVHLFSEEGMDDLFGEVVERLLKQKLESIIKKIKEGQEDD